MTSHFDLPDDVRARAAMYVAGALTGEERRAFEEHLATSAEARQALQELLAVQDLLFRATPNVTPHRALVESVCAQFQRDAAMSSPDHTHHHADHIWDDWDDDASRSSSGLFTLSSEERDWQPTGIEGIEVRPLFVDRPNNRMTAMFRMAAGTEYVPHLHDGHEECYVLEGDLHVGEEIIMHAGDYQRAEAGSTHGRQWTERGCVLLISSSLSDEAI
ncbi:MAG: cupin domain-containing protein [Phycisphaerales bacterium]